MRKKTWVDDFLPLSVLCMAQVVVVSLQDSARSSADSGENASYLLYVRQILAVLIAVVTIRLIRNVLRRRGISLLEWFRSSAVLIVLGLCFPVVAHFDSLLALSGKLLGPPAAGASSARPLADVPLYAFLQRHDNLRWALDFIGLLVCLLPIRRAVPVDADLSLAREAFRSGDFTRAGEAYLKLGDVGKAKKAFTKAKAPARVAALELREGNGKAAAELYEEAGAAFSWEASRAWLSAGDLARAGRCQAAAIAEARGSARWDRLLEIAEALTDYAGIEEASRRLAEAKPPGPARTGLFRRAAEAARALSRWESAGESYRAAGDTGLAAESFVKAGRFAEAAKEFERAGDLAGAAEALQKAGNEKAADEFRARDAEGKGDLLSAAEAWSRLGLHDRAASLFERKGLVSRAAEAWRAAGRPERAAPLFLKAGDNPSAAALFEAAGQAEKAAGLYRDLGDPLKAAELFRTAGKVADVARMLDLAGRFQEAVPFYERASLPLEAARCALKSGRREQAWEKLMSVPRSSPGVSEFFRELGEAHLAAGEARDAVHVFRAALGPSPVTKENVELHLALVRALEAAGDTAEAASRLRRVEDFDPTMPGVHERSTQHLGATPVSQAQVSPASSPPPPRGTSGAHAQVSLVSPSPQTPPRSGAFPRSPGPRDAPIEAPLGLQIPRREETALGVTPRVAGSSGAFPEPSEERYRIGEELGRGGMGAVYRALDTRLDRFVALKILPPSDDNAKRYFEREAKAIAALQHPNVVAIYDYGQGFGSAYLAMECVEGQNLHLMMKSDPERVKRNWRPWFVQAARGVAAAHAKGILHRDLKPANLMVDAHDNIRILDFGLARPTSDSVLTSQLIGTPAFFPPDVLRGETPTPASDVYSLGASFYTLATGRWPYVGDDVLVARLERDPDDPRPFAPFLSEDEVRILLKSLARFRPERYQTAGDLLGALLSLEG